eukprot:TRINITY_DN109252_c0_g1_i1.p1 TRINITY_DN109252_c0_g1~~TRINITY_DN109252_c0_g1_i1.p1  ORF type:complete len:300 (+),score=44.16 TRINITY_DN109252_c0_g1_i1:55-954(+)
MYDDLTEKELDELADIARMREIAKHFLRRSRSLEDAMAATVGEQTIPASAVTAGGTTYELGTVRLSEDIWSVKRKLTELSGVAPARQRLILANSTESEQRPLKDGDVIWTISKEIDPAEGLLFTMLCNASDTFSASFTDPHNLLTAFDGVHNKTVKKRRGPDYTNTLGDAVVSFGCMAWDIRVDEHRGNMRIGVAYPEIKLDTGMQEPVSRWRNKLEHSWYVKSSGNSSDENSRAAGRPFASTDFGKGDVIRVEANLDAGTIAWFKNSAPMCEPQTNLIGPVRLVVSMDYDGEQVTIIG